MSEDIVESTIDLHDGCVFSIEDIEIYIFSHL